MSVTLKDAYLIYKSWISRNPLLTSDIESSIKWITYFVSGRISESNVLSELVYSVSNLLVLFNDRIIVQSYPLNSATEGDKLKTWITVLEYSEAFIEVTALKYWGKKGKWIIVVLIQLLKCAARLILLFHHKERIIQNPPIPPLERRKVSKEKDLVNMEMPSPGFRLQSGRVIRSISATGPVHSRTWQPPNLPEVSNNEKKEEPPLDNLQLLGEALYIMKPIVHLGASYCFSPTHWMPWLVSLGLDSTSLQLLKHKNASKLSHRQSLEISRRNLALLLYLLRSPFYEKHTRRRLMRTLLILSDNLPIVGLLLRPLAQFIPRWQETYFYMWST